ncbi:TonB-dependent siderophore receptor [Cyanosarcina cf. burmensis CCALA 770]|nr:TonB-dependent siderophore receptor [Cyanosarcina cf. burmensis CCALA 770]
MRNVRVGNWKAIAFWVGLAAVMPLWSEPVFAQVKTIEELPPVSFSAKELLAQERENSSLTQVTGVKLNPTERGLQIVLVTPSGQKLQPSISPVENNLAIDIPNAVLALPDRQEFTATNPTAEIAQVTVKPLNASSIRVTITGSKQAPNAEVVPSEQDLVLNVTSQATAQTEEPELEIVVTGEQEGYAVTNSSVGTRTDTPLRDIPQSIQVIPQQVLEDQGANDLDDALRNVSGTSNSQYELPNIRGFYSGRSILSDGIRRLNSARYDVNLGNVEQIEVLKGPSSVLYGSGEPGGTINLTTKQPQSNPNYEIEGTIGNFNYYQGNLDLTGPLNDNKTILYRLNIAYEDAGSFIDSVDSQEFAIFPVLSFQLGERTKLTLEGSYEDRSIPDVEGLPTVGTIFPNPLGEVPDSRFLGEPDNNVEYTAVNVGYLLDHKFSENWSLRNRFRAFFFDLEQRGIGPLELAEDNRTVIRSARDNKEYTQTYTLQTDVLGKFQTGIIQHDLLLGLELQRNIEDSSLKFPPDVPSIDLFEPEYLSSSNFDDYFDRFEPDTDELITSDTIGVYAQDLLSIGDRVKILLGGRFDGFSNKSEDNLADTSETFEDSAFSPRVGLVYQPIESVSLYGSWTSSFVPEFDTDREGNPFVPVTGDQFEVGVKAESLDGKFRATLAAYQITRQNALITDPVDPDFSIQTGESRVRGIEFDLSGELLPGLNVIASYAHTDAKITEDTTGLEGNEFEGIPRHSGSLWAVYEIQQGGLQGLGLGAGVFVVGDRQGDSENTFEVPSYGRTDALLYYRRDNWQVQLNFENLFNVDYFVSASGRANVYPGAPFTVRGKVAVEF